MARKRATTGDASTEDGARDRPPASGLGSPNPGVAPLVSLLFLIAVGVMLVRRGGGDSSAFEVDTRPSPDRVIDHAPNEHPRAGDARFEREIEEVEGLYYRVKRGDTLEGIAKRFYSNPRAWEPIAKVNRIQEPKRLRAGRVIWIPALQMNP